MSAVGSVAMFAATITVGLTAGLFFAFAVAVMPGLARTDAATFVRAMQRINVAIVNPVFLVVFLGPLPTLALGAARGPSRTWATAALVLYAATVAITVAGNIPLNNALMKVPTDQGGAVLEAGRAEFETRWNRLHLIRTVAVIASFVCCLAALRAG